MGNESGREGGLGRNWRHVSPSLIRNEHTHQLIQQDTLSFPNPDTQHFTSQLLTKRIRLQHPHVLKLIYFMPSGSYCSCSADGNPYRTTVYTEYVGDSLTDYLAINPPPYRGPCPCQAIIEAAVYLHQFYGFFEVNEEKVFLGLQQQDSDIAVKVWVNANRSECEPDRICSQRQMIVSLANLYAFISNNGFCNAISNQENHILRNARTLNQLKNQLLKLHCDGAVRERKKSSSVMEERRCSRKDTPMEDFEEERHDIVRISKHQKEQYRYQSTPHTIQSQHTNIKVHFVQPERPATERPTVREVKSYSIKPPDLTLSTQNTYILQGNPSIQTVPSQQENQVPPLQFPKKVHFNYSPPIISNPIAYEKVPILRENEKKEMNVFWNAPSNHHVQKKNARPLQNKINYRPAILFEQNYGIYPLNQNVIHQNSLMASPVSQAREQKNVPQQVLQEKQQETTLLGSVTDLKPLQIKNEDLQPVFIKFSQEDMEIPLKEDAKEPAPLPTTSRSPKHPKQEINAQPEVIDQSVEVDLPVPERRSRRLDSYSSSRGGTNRVKYQNNTRNEKIQQYAKQIKQAEENIRQRMSQSNKKEKKLHQVNTAPIKSLKPPLPPSDYKQVSSIYNDSQKQYGNCVKQEYRIRTQNFEEVYQVDPVKNKMDSFPSQQSSGGNDVERYQAEIKAEYLKQKEEERERLQARESELEEEKKFEEEQKKKIAERKKKWKEEEDRKKVEREEKNEIEKDLENEKKMIQNQMDDLLRNSAMKEEYKSIREKVKQKKENFAALKAQAAKILEDCLY